MSFYRNFKDIPYHDLPFAYKAAIDDYKKLFTPGSWFFALNENPQYYFYRVSKLTKNGIATLNPLIDGFSFSYDENGVNYIILAESPRDWIFDIAKIVEIPIYTGYHGVWTLPNLDKITSFEIQKDEYSNGV